MMRKKALIFGTGGFGEVVDFYLTRDSDYEVVAYTATADAVTAEEFQSRPLISFDDIESKFSPDQHDMFIAVGYKKLNAVREQFCHLARAKGYRLLTYVCSKATHWNDIVLGDNVFIFEDNTVQPFVRIGDGTILWSGNHIGHHSTIGSYCFITSHVVVSGYCRIGNRCFLGVNSTVADDTEIADENILGPGALVQKSSAAKEVYIAERTPKFPKDSSRFFK